jgi:succinate dehydrogenase/fumarate reductase flavoprotein subunit
VVEDNVNRRGITLSLETQAKRLITSPDGRIVGILAEKNKQRFTVKARRGVILACGGFEAAEDLKEQFVQGSPILSAAFRGNTGDGIRMSQEVGAALWHMWNIHGSYGFRHTDSDYPFAIRMARLPDWIPGDPMPDGAQMPWIIVDQTGRRYMNEYPPYLNDIGHKPMQWLDTESQRYPRIPSSMIIDEEGRQRCPLGLPTFNDPEVFFEWSEDNLAEIELGILRKAETVAEMAKGMNVDEEILKATIDRWNDHCARETDIDFGRPAESLMSIRTSPFYYADMWPLVSNTQGGPVHNENWQVLDAFGEPIPGLYEAGELGGIWGYLYLAGGNMAECYIGGWNAGRHAAGNEPWSR